VVRVIHFVRSRILGLPKRPVAGLVCRAAYTPDAAQYRRRKRSLDATKIRGYIDALGLTANHKPFDITTATP
jgi:hypothetical protein